MRKRGFAAAADQAIGHIEAAKFLDGPSYKAETAIARPAQIAGRRAAHIGEALHGTRYGHPIHPMLVTVPIGSWTFALAVDLLGALGVLQDRSSAQAADAALKMGAAGAVAAAAAGLADWQHTNGRDRRVGLVHAAVNVTALVLNLRSIALRRRGWREAGRMTSAAAWGCMFVGGYLGGHLVYRRRVGVDHADRSPAPRAFWPVLSLAELEQNRPRLVTARDEQLRQEIGVVLVRQGELVHAMGARCSHQGGPLDQGWVLEGTLVCPWHGTRYDLQTGRPVSGPSTCPQPRYQARVRDGIVEIRREQEPGDQVVTDSAAAPSAPEDGPADGKKADQVLFEHHELIRRLFREIEATPAEDPQRRDLMRVLATELEIHEHIEDKIFYPAVEPVSEDIPVAHSEHRQLADLLAITLKLNTATPTFEEHLRALYAAVDHHAGSEERSLFRQAQRLGDARLRELGRALEAMMEQQRTSLLRRAFLSLKVRLLEGA